MSSAKAAAIRRSTSRADSGLEYPTGVMPLSVRCAGRLDTQFILEAFKQGFTGVVICKCKDDHCLNIVGNTDLDRRANLFRAVLSSRGHFAGPAAHLRRLGL